VKEVKVKRWTVVNRPETRVDEDLSPQAKRLALK
jgi:hypothetical protein